jgi:hypothetical protein
VQDQPGFNPCADDAEWLPSDDGGMTTTDYILNAAFLLIVLRQARERRLDLRSIIGPVVLMFFVAQTYLRAVPTAGNDLVLIAGLASVGLALGLVTGFATYVRPGEGGLALARVGWLAGMLLTVGIASRMVFAFAVSHGAEPAVRSFSIAHHIGAAAWPAALVLMALCEVGARIATVQMRGWRSVVSVP